MSARQRGGEAPVPTESSAATAGSELQLDRRAFLGVSTGACAAVLGSWFLGWAAPSAAATRAPLRKNLLLVLTDQERALMWFPAGWEEFNLPSLTRLSEHGLTFRRAFTASAMCSPARNTLFTGLFPAQHGSYDTLTEIEPQDRREHQLDPSLPNLATCLKEVGYQVVYKGKWHLSAGVVGADGREIRDDPRRYGFDGWDSPDAGGDTAVENFGGGHANHDRRFLDDAVTYLRARLAAASSATSPQPFCLVVSLVNPHDVLGYPRTYLDGGYTDDPWLNPTSPPIALPPTENENLSLNRKPTAHRDVLTAVQTALGPLVTETAKQKYLNFYGNLLRHVDGQIGELLAVLDAAGDQALRDTLVIRTSDHGEMGLCHGGLRQKTFVCYEETIRVPLVWSNPELFPAARTTDALVSHVDLLPTLCSLMSVPNWQAKGFKGVDYSSIVLDPSAPAVQDYVLFTFDDIFAGQDRTLVPNGVAGPPNRIQMIRTADFKYARYFDAAGAVADQGEFYDLRPGGGDYDTTNGLPLELRNLSAWATAQANAPAPNAVQLAARNKLANDLAAAVTTRLQSRPASAPVPPDQLRLNVVRWSESGAARSAAEVSFLSRWGETYQLQRSEDLVQWVNVGDPVPGNNGPILLRDDLQASRAYYRLQWAAA